MELMVRDGDYLPDGRGGLCRAEGDEAILQRVLWRLTARRGSFPFLPELGSRLYTLPGEKRSHWVRLAQQYVAEALAGEEDLTVKGVTVTQEKGAALLRTALEYRGEPMTVTARVEGIA